jgi:hypothetical protein
MAELPMRHHLHERLARDPEDCLDFYELRHFGASYMLNDLELEPWVVAEQLRQSDGGVLVSGCTGIHRGARRSSASGARMGIPHAIGVP